MFPDVDTEEEVDFDLTGFDDDLESEAPLGHGPVPLLETASTRPVQLDGLLPPFQNAEAALLFIGSELVFASRDERGWSLKCISLDSARAAFSTTSIDTGWIDPALQRFGTTPEGPWAVAYHPPARRSLLMEYRRQTVKLTIPMPGLVFIGLGINYHLFALTEVFSPSANLCHAPFPNISNQNGWICFGSNQRMPATPPNMAIMWELIWNTRFNADWRNNRCKSEPTDVRKLLMKLQRRARFPDAELLPTGTTIQQAVHSWTSRS